MLFGDFGTSSKKMGLPFKILSAICVIGLLTLMTQPVVGQDKLSPAFSRQFEPDSVNDLKPFPRQCPNSTSLPDIRAASYFSNGKNLSGTLWLSKPVNDSSIKDNLYTPGYIMILDVNPTIDITERGNDKILDHLDYEVVTTPDNNNTNWLQQIHEMSGSSSNGVTRLLNQINLTQASVLDEQLPYVKFSLDLGLIDYPNTYSVTFLALYGKQIGSQRCVMFDFILPSAYVPKAEFDVAVSPAKIILRPGESKIAELTINSTLQLPHNVKLSYDNSKYDDFVMDFEPNVISVLPDGMGISKIQLNATSNPAVEEFHTVPITAEISFPTLQGEVKSASPVDPTRRGEAYEGRIENASSSNKTEPGAPSSKISTANLEQLFAGRTENASSSNKTEPGAPSANTSTANVEQLPEGRTENASSSNKTEPGAPSSKISTANLEQLFAGRTENASSSNKTEPGAPSANTLFTNVQQDFKKRSEHTSRSVPVYPFSPQEFPSMVNVSVAVAGDSIERREIVRTPIFVSTLPSISPSEHFVNFWTGWGGFIGLIAGTFVGLAGFLFSRRKDR